MLVRVTSGGAGRPRFLASLLRILRATQLCSLSSVTPAGTAHINTAYFAYSRELELYILSDPTSRHAQNLRVNRTAAATVFDSTQRWGGSDRGAQLFGRCEVTRGAARTKAEEVYASRFRDYRSWRDGLRPEAVAHAWQFYRLVPRTVTILDEKEFGSGIFVTARFGRP